MRSPGPHHQSKEPCPVHGFRRDEGDDNSAEDHYHDPLFFSPKRQGQLHSPRGQRGPWPPGNLKHGKGHDSRVHERKIRERWEADRGPYPAQPRVEPSLSPRHPQHVGHQPAARVQPSTTHKAVHPSAEEQERAALEARAELRAVQKLRAAKLGPVQQFGPALHGAEAQAHAFPEPKKDYEKHGIDTKKKRGKKKKKKRRHDDEKIVVSTPTGPFSPGTKAVKKTQKAMKKAKEMWDVNQYLGTCCLFIEIVVTAVIVTFALYWLASPSDKDEKRGDHSEEDTSENIPPILAINILAAHFAKNASTFP